MKKESRYVEFARRAYELTKAILPAYMHRNSPKTYSLPQLAACVMLKFYLNMTYRDFEDWLLASDKVCAVLELEQVPDHSTISRAYRKLNKKLLEQLHTTLLEKAEVVEETIAGDSTTFTLSQASSYYRTRSGKSFSEGIKGAYAVGIGTQLVMSTCTSPGHLPDFHFLKPLKRGSGRYGLKKKCRRAWLFLGDSGFDSRDVADGDLVYPIRRGANLVDAKRRARADLVSAARLDGIMGYRWLVETVNSVIKRKLGDDIRSRNKLLQMREPVIKGIINIHRLIALCNLSNFATEQLAGVLGATRHHREHVQARR